MPDPLDPNAPAWPGPDSGQPGSPPPQPYPGQPYPGQPYPGQPYPGQPYPGQPYQGQPSPGQPGQAGWQGHPGHGLPGQPPPPQQPVRVGSGGPGKGLIVGLVVALVAALGLGVLGVRWWMGREAEPVALPTTTMAPAPTTARPSPSASATRSRSVPSTTGSPAPTTSGGPGGPPSGPSAPASGPMRANGFSFTAPAGWTRSATWGERNEAQIVDGAGHVISVYLFKSPASADARCQAELKALQAFVPGQITSVEPTTIGGLAGAGGTLENSTAFYQMYCVKRGDLIYNLSLRTTPSQRSAGVAALKAVASTWQWG